MLTLRDRVDQGAMAIKWYSAFPKVPTLQQFHPQIVYCHIRKLVTGGSYPSAKVLTVYSAVPADRAKVVWTHSHNFSKDNILNIQDKVYILDQSKSIS